MSGSLQGRVVRLDNAVHQGGPRQQPVTLIVMHTTEGGSAKSSIDYLNRTADKKASYHYVIEDDGTIYRMTPPAIVAYHSGDSAWPNPIRATKQRPFPNQGSVNPVSIGIAWANNGERIPPAAMESALWLVTTLMHQYRLTTGQVVGHLDVSPGRKIDPSSAIAMPEFRAQLSDYLETQD